MKLRDYQEKALADIRGLYASGKKRVLLQLATGAGKTLVFCTILKSARERGSKCVMVVRGRSLVDQASRRLSEIDVPHSVFMANDKRYDENELIQIVSIDTVNSRKSAPAADLVIIDEAHYAVSKSFFDFLEYYPEAFWLSVTATPWVKKTLRHLVTDESCVVYPIGIRDLIKQGYLCDAEYWAPSKFDTSKIGVNSTGEYKDEDVLTTFESQHVYGDVVKNFKNKCLGEPSLVFCVNKKHADIVAKSFDTENISNTVVTAETKIEERLELIKKLENRELNAIISIGTMTTGVDIPDLRNLIVCRPTTSRNLHVQMLGRGTRRPLTDKKVFRVFDHVGNVMKHGAIVDEERVDLTPPEKKQRATPTFFNVPLKRCEECGAICSAGYAKCPECDAPFEMKRNQIVNVKTEMVQLNVENYAIRIKALAPGMLRYMWAKGGKNSARLWHLLKAKIPEEELMKNRRVYWGFKQVYESWLNGSAPAPGPFNSDNIWE